jgi:hypothetical protein
MIMPVLSHPSPSDYPPYYQRYLDLVPEGDILELLAEQRVATCELLQDMDDERAAYRYGPGKWSIKETVGHLVDTERVFAFRALWFARNDPSALPGFEQDDWVIQADFDTRRWSELVSECRAVREATLNLFHGIPLEAWDRRGEAAGNAFAVRAIPFIIAGHEAHHMKVLREKYLRT